MVYFSGFETPYGWNRGNDASPIGIDDVVLMHIDIGMILHFQYRMKFSWNFIVKRGLDNFNVFSVVQIFIKKRDSFESVRRSIEEKNEIVQPSPGSQASRRGAAEKVKVWLADPFFGSSKYLMEVIVGCPLIFPELKGSMIINKFIQFF